MVVLQVKLLLLLVDNGIDGVPFNRKDMVMTSSQAKTREGNIAFFYFTVLTWKENRNKSIRNGNRQGINHPGDVAIHHLPRVF